MFCEFAATFWENITEFSRFGETWRRTHKSEKSLFRAGFWSLRVGRFSAEYRHPWTLEGRRSPAQERGWNTSDGWIEKLATDC